MQVTKYFGVEGAKQAKGTTIIIDIFRASTTAAYLLSRGVEKILPVSTEEEAFAQKKIHPDWILVGENHGIQIKGFDYGNSPFEITHANNLDGKTVVFRSSQGTQGITNATNANEIIFGSFSTCTAITNYLKETESKFISIVAMDGVGSEDEIFADYLIGSLTESQTKNINEIIDLMKKHPGAWRFLDPNNKDFPKEDFSLCLGLDTFNFVPLLKNGFLIKY